MALNAKYTCRFRIFINHHLKLQIFKCIQNHSRRKVVNTKVVKTQKDYDKKGSKKRTIKTVVQTTIKTTTVELSQMSGVSGTTLRTLGSQADGKILK